MQGASQLKKGERVRIHLLDEVRGVAVFCMVLYHCFFQVGITFGYPWGEKLFNFFMPAQPFFAGLFIFISGIACRLSRSNAIRGFRLFGIALAFSFVSIVLCPLIGLDRLGIRFGILHLLSVSMLVFSAAQTALDRISPQWGILLCTLLYVFTADIGEGSLRIGELIRFELPEVLYEHNFLFPFGIYSNTFFSADYFPVFPHIFLFLAGSYAGVYASRGLFPRQCYSLHSPAFSWLGRHALVVYVAHQPIIIGLIYLVKLIFKI